MNKRTRIDSSKCPKTVTVIRERLNAAKENDKNFCIFKGMAYQEVEGEIWMVTVNPGKVSENNWTDADYGF